MGQKPQKKEKKADPFFDGIFEKGKEMSDVVGPQTSVVDEYITNQFANNPAPQ